MSTNNASRGWLGLTTFLVGTPAVFAQGEPPLPVELAPITRGIDQGFRISSDEMRGRFEVLVEAINALHARVDVLERQTLTQGTYNLAFHYDARTGRFSIRCLDEQSQAVACSANNPGYVVMPSVRHGGLVRLVVDTDEHYFHDARAAAANQDLAGNSFNSAPGRAWPERRPFFIYAVNRDDTNEGLRFGLTLHPAATRVPQFGAEGGRHVVGGRKAPADANEAVDFVFLWGDGDDRAELERDYKVVPKPVLRVGSLELTKLVVGGVDQWRVERWGPDLDANGASVGEWRVGLGRYPWGVDYTLPAGAAYSTAEGSFFHVRHGMVVSEGSVRYRIAPDGDVEVLTDLIELTPANRDQLTLVPPYANGAVDHHVKRDQYMALGTWRVFSPNRPHELVSLTWHTGGVVFSRWLAPDGVLNSEFINADSGALGALWFRIAFSYRAFLD